MPALLVLVLASLAIGWWFFPQGDYRVLGEHSVSALAFISNHVFWAEAGYFDVNSHEKWLLHTWSLSVEWQFYLVLPVAMLLIWKCRPGRPFLLLALSLGAVASLAVSIVLSHYNPSAAFFLLPSRAWQMLAGGLVFLTAEKIGLRGAAARRVELVGLLMIGLSVVAFDGTAVWPGVNALLPVVGAAMVIMAAQQSAWAKNPFVQWIGLSSYSIYLWHWPVVVALVYLEQNENPLAVVVGTLLAVILGGLSYHLIENPTRTWFKLGSPLRAASVLVGSVTVLIVPASAIYFNEGIPGRMHDAVEVASAEASNFNAMREQCHHAGGTEFPWCTIGGEDIRAVVVGDSHASAVFGAVEAAFAGAGNSNSGIIASSHTACPTLFGVKRESPNWTCPQFNEFIIRRLAEVPVSVPLFIVNRSSQYVFGNQGSETHRPSIYFDQPPGTTSSEFLMDFQASLIDTACALANGREVYLVRPIPEMPFDVPKILSRRILRGDASDIRITRALYDDRHAFIIGAQDAAAERCNVGVLEVADYLCDAEHCYGSEEGRPLYYDDDHLSEFGNRKLIPMFQAAAGMLSGS